MSLTIKGVERSGFSRHRVEELVKRTVAALGRGNDDVAIVFTGMGKIRDLNCVYRGKDEATDILSFPADAPNDLGDIFICPRMAKVKAEKRGDEYDAYLSLLIVHGILHLDGYDHETKKDTAAMARMEKKILN